jgi:hypothetical protein
MELRRNHPRAPVATNRMIPTTASQRRPWSVKPKIVRTSHTTSNRTSKPIIAFTYLFRNGVKSVTLQPASCDIADVHNGPFHGPPA